MTYIKNQEAFNLTQTKMSYWHRHALHVPRREDCVFCSGSMSDVVKFLRRKGFKIIASGSAFVKISAPTNVRQEKYGWTSDEADELFKVVTSKE